MVGRQAAIGVAVLAAMIASAHAAAAQVDSDRQELRVRIEQRFDVLPVQDGIVLRPKRPNQSVRSIQVTGGDIALDGELVTGGEVRRRLGADADLIIRLSYLSGPDQRALFRNEVAPSAEPAPPIPPDVSDFPTVPRPPRAPRLPRQNRGGSDRVRIGGGVQVNQGEVINGDVVAIGGDARIDGQVQGDVVCVAGNMELGPNADVAGDVTVVAGTLRRDPGAKIAGGVHEVGWGELNLLPNLRGTLPGVGGYNPRRTGGGPFFAVVSTLVRLAILCLLTSLVFVFGREYVERVGVRAAEEPIKAGLVGVLIQILLLPLLLVTILVMIITIIGIPLLLLIPFALVALAIIWMVGFAAVAQDVGRFLAGRLKLEQPSPYLVLALGIAGLLSPVLIGGLIGLGGAVLVPLTYTLLFLGFFIEYLAWTVGLGAVALLRFERR